MLTKLVLGQTAWASKDRTSCPEILNTSYWRDLEAVHAFAHSPLHREAWDYWNRTVKSHDFLGVHYEVCEAEAKRWENVYADFQPTGLGATSYLRRADGKLEGGEEADEWVSPLLSANKGKLSTSSGRLGLGKGDENEKYGKSVYEDWWWEGRCDRAPNAVLYREVPQLGFDPTNILTRQNRGNSSDNTTQETLAFIAIST
jgi:hypothetical protein